MNFLQNVNKKVRVVVFVFLLLILFVIILTINNISKQKKINTISPTISPSQENTQINPSYKKNAFIPTYTPDKGRGVDLGAPLVANSLQEIQKLYPFLPYKTTIKTAVKQEISIVIPDKTSQTNIWTLQIYVFGLDYHLTKENPEYITSKNSFTTAVSSLYKWIAEKGADTKKIMIVWGDKEYIQNKSQEWLE